MGCSYRKSVPFGPVRINFSKRGVGASIGVRGARISVGSRGTYVHLGAGGFRYVQRIDSKRSSRDSPPDDDQESPWLSTDEDFSEQVEQIEPACLEESDADAVLREIREKQNRGDLTLVVSLVSSLIILPALIFALIEATRPMAIAMGSLAIVGLLSRPWTAWRDRAVRTVRIYYVADPLGKHVQEGIRRLFVALTRTHALWSVQFQHDHGDWKRNAGAEIGIDRYPVQAGFKVPPGVKTNVAVGCLRVGRQELYFFPDRIFAYGPSGVGSIAYEGLQIQGDDVDFAEDEYVHRDTTVIDHTWLYVNKNGTRDRRFSDNRKIPIVLYGQLTLTAPSFRFVLQTSSAQMGPGAAEMLTLIQRAIESIKASDSKQELVATIPQDFDFDDDPLPLSGLPEWVYPIVLGLVISIPGVLLVVFVFRAIITG